MSHRTFSIIALLLCIGVSAGCWREINEPPFPEVTAYSAGWEIQNISGRDVTVSINTDIEFTEDLRSGATTVFQYLWDKPEQIPFGGMFEDWGMTDATEISIRYKGEVVKTWHYSERNKSGRQFFNRDYWDYDDYEFPDGYHQRTWVFELRYEDIEISE